MVDMSSDKNRREILGIVVRSGEINEHALDLKYTENRTALDELAVLLQSFADEETSTDGIVAQCYASLHVSMEACKSCLVSQTSFGCERHHIIVLTMTGMLNFEAPLWN